MNKLWSDEAQKLIAFPWAETQRLSLPCLIVSLKCCFESHQNHPQPGYSGRRACNRKCHDAISMHLYLLECKSTEIHLGNNSATMAVLPTGHFRGSLILQGIWECCSLAILHQAAAGVLLCHLHFSIYLFLYSSPLPEQPLPPALSLRCCCRIFPSRFQRIMSPKVTPVLLCHEEQRASGSAKHFSTLGRV